MSLLSELLFADIEFRPRFFFSSRRRHTRYWRDWSSDVCSSDLAGHGTDAEGGGGARRRGHRGRAARPGEPRVGLAHDGEIGRASCREIGYIAGGDVGV